MKLQIRVLTVSLCLLAVLLVPVFPIANAKRSSTSLASQSFTPPAKGGAEWAAADKLIAEQKFQAALDATEAVLAKAKNANSVRLWTEALIRSTQLRMALHGYETAVRGFREADGSKAWPKDPEGRVLLGLYYGFALNQYRQMYAWEINSREKSVSNETLDLKAWTSNQIGVEISRNFDVIMKNEVALGKPVPAFFSTYVTSGNYPNSVRSTLRDLVVYMAVGHLADSNYWTPRESAEVYKNDPERLALTPPIIRIAAIDTTHHPLEKIASWLGEHREFHRKAGRAEAALGATYELVQILFNAMTEPADRSRLRTVFKQIQNGKKTGPWWSRGQALLVEFIRQIDQPGRLIDARAEAQLGIVAFPRSPGSEMCEALVREIERPEYSMTSMKTDASNRRSIEIRYKNIKKMYFRAYALDIEKTLTATKGRPGFFAFETFTRDYRTSGVKPLSEWSQELPPTPDFASHRLLSIPKISQPGAYIILSSTRSDFSGNDDVVQAVRFINSDLVLTTLASSDGQMEVRAVSGSKGTAIENADITLYRYTWSSVPVAVETKKTNREGVTIFEDPGRSPREYGMYFVFARSGALLALDEQNTTFSRRGGSQDASASFMFTDRSIYRPGQKIFWKVAGYKGNTTEGSYTTADKGTSIEVRLMDPNNQIVEKRMVTFGDFGTAAGEFAVPTGRPLGMWRVQAFGRNPGFASIRVEEYKRPTFESTLKDTAVLRLGKKAEIKGETKYYFGLPVSEGSVVWRVKREEVAPTWWSWFYSWTRPRSQAEVVATGSTKLRKDGTFEIEFTPDADLRKAAKNPGLTYVFNIEADVTDEGGETRTVSRSFRLGFVSLEAELTWANDLMKTGLPIEMMAKLRTLDGNPRAGKGSYRIVRLNQPAKTPLPADLPRSARADAEGDGDFERFATPDDRSRARWETDFDWSPVVSAWTDGVEIEKGPLTHGVDGIAPLRLKSIAQSGAYRIYYETQDDFGTPYKISRPFLVTSAHSRVALPLVFLAGDLSVEVGSKAKFFVHSGLSNQNFLIEVFRAGRRISNRTWTSGKDSSFFEIGVSKEDRGGFTVAVSGVRDHQFMRKEISVLVPWTDRTLKFEFSTFRDTLRPGSKQTFRITTRSADGKPVSAGEAEVLASMYDRSLDLFGVHAYPNFLGLYPSRTGSLLRSATLGAAATQHVSGQFASIPPGPSFYGDSLRFYEGYAIGGAGSLLGSFDKAVPRSALVNLESVSTRGASAMAKGMSADGEASPERQASALRASAPARSPETAVSDAQVRSNFSETAFFRPNLITDARGSVSFEFEVPDSVTSWNVFAHALTKDIKSGFAARETKSVKELMVRPYVPRFLREGDQAEIKVTVNNASATTAKGDVYFDIESVETGKSVATEFGLKPLDLKKSFSALGGGSATIAFSVKAPRNIGTYAFRVTAKSRNFSDGERRAFPVLPSRMHLAQSRFVTLKGKDRRVLEFQDLARGGDPSLINEKLVVTVDAQLFFSVLQSLPYLVNYPYECVEQTLNRFLATGIVTSVFDRFPAVAEMAKKMSSRNTQFEGFGETDANRRMTLEETPWLENSHGNAKGSENSSDQIDLLPILDSKVAQAERERALNRLKKMQLSNGAFPWFEGGRADEYMTLYTVMGFGRALEYKIDVPKDMVVKSWSYLRTWLDENVERMMAHDCCWEMITSVNFAASMYPDATWTANRFDDAYRKRLLDYSFKYWKKHSPLLKGYLAMTLHRMGRQSDAKLVWDSVMDSSKTDDQLGTYWAAEDRSWLWYNDTIESHAFSLRALMELSPGDKRRDGLVQWLFLNKKLNHWKSTKATAEAIYALVHYLEETKALGAREAVSVDIGNQKTEFIFEPNVYTGKKNQIVLLGEKINPKLNSKIVIEQSTPGLSFASATWHFSTDRIPKEDRGDFFSVTRKYMKRELIGREWILKPIGSGEKVRIGDQIEVQISIRTKHAAEYVHLRDPRAAGLEPESVVSGYKYDLGLSWFEEIRDSGANFFFTRLPVGEYTFKYRLRANMAGSFRIGPATIQSIYAPEFNAYSTGTEMSIAP